MAKIDRQLLALTAFILFVTFATGTAADKPSDPCSLLTPAEIQAVVGKPVEKGTPKVHSNPMAGSDCTFVIGDYGSLNLLVKPLQRGESLERVKAQLAKRKMAATDVAGIGDGAFHTSPGFGMVQMHAFHKDRYVLITLMVPGLEAPAVQPLAIKLMKTALTRIK